jgi:inner membrane protein
MSFDDWWSNAGVLWLLAAAALGIAELAIPGVFLIFLAIAAAIVGVATLALPDLPVAVQLIAFAVWSAITVMVGRRWYTDYPVATTDPFLNNRAARMVGEVVTVSKAIEDGRGRVHIGDSDWIAMGPDAPVGSRLRIVAVEDGVVQVAPDDQARDSVAIRE